MTAPAHAADLVKQRVKNDLAIIYRDPKSLAAYARNSRTHTDDQIDKLKASILEYGFTNPILLKDDGKTIGAGHARCRAALALNLASVPTITLLGLTTTLWRSYVIADNQLAITGSGWDFENLRLELEDLMTEGFGVDLLGFNADEFAAIMNPVSESEADPDAEVDPPDAPVSVLGDVWILGDHRIVCGSSTEAPTVVAALGGSAPHLMVTDPPYGVNYDASWREDAGINKSTAASGKVLNDDNADWTAAWALFQGDVAYVWHSGSFAGVVGASLEATGFGLRSQIIWVKQHMVMSRCDYHWKHESCWYAVRKGKPGRYVGGRKQTTVWDIDKPHKSETGHSTQKPIECMKRPIENNSKPGDAVYEPFSGSGTTIIAGEMTGRHIRAIELNPAYVDVAVIRWQKFASGEATLEATGQTFAAVAAERAL